MNHKDLRTGNFVLNSNLEIDKILGIEIGVDYDDNFNETEYAIVCLEKNGYGETDIKPISISCQILAELSKSKKFEAKLQRGDEIHFEDKEHTIVFQYESEEEGIYYTGGEGVKLSRYFKYVHELQNFLYELERFELKLI